MDPKSAPEQRAAEEPRRDRFRRYALRTWLYTWAGALLVLLVLLIALVVANTRSVRVSWVFGSTHQSLVWIILATAILGWLLGIVTSVVFQFRTRAPGDHALQQRASASRGIQRLKSLPTMETRRWNEGSVGGF